MLAFVAGVNGLEEFEPNQVYLKDKFIPAVLQSSVEVPEVLKEMIAHEYTLWDEPNNMERRRSKALQLMSDKFFTASMEFTLSEHSKLAKDSISTYMYQFGIILPKTMYPTPSWFHNATHIDELMYIFYDEDTPLYHNLPSPTDRQLEDWESDAARYVMDLFTNFAKTGYVLLIRIHSSCYLTCFRPNHSICTFYF